jgi:hypothetical protein
MLNTYYDSENPQQDECVDSSVDSSMVLSMDESTIDSNDKWTLEIENALAVLHMACLMRSKYHKDNYLKMHALLKYFKIPIIILSAISSVFNVALTPFIRQDHVSLICCFISLSAGLIGSIELFLQVQKTMEINLFNAKEFHIIALDICKVLSLDRKSRMKEPIIYLDEKYNSYIKLLENSVIIDKPIYQNIMALGFVNNLTPVEKIKIIVDDIPMYNVLMSRENNKNKKNNKNNINLPSPPQNVPEIPEPHLEKNELPISNFFVKPELHLPPPPRNVNVRPVPQFPFLLEPIPHPHRHRHSVISMHRASDKDRHPSDTDRHPSDTDRHPSDADKYPYGKDRHPYGKDRHPSDTDRHPYGKDRHPYGKDRHPSSKDRHPSSKDRYPSDRDRYPYSETRKYSVTHANPSEFFKDVEFELGLALDSDRMRNDISMNAIP